MNVYEQTYQTILATFLLFLILNLVFDIQLPRWLRKVSVLSAFCGGFVLIVLKIWGIA